METVTAQDDATYDVVIVGAGVCGIYTLYRIRQLGLRVTVLEAGDGPGGTWYWNRYPGARFDSESYSYGYSFSRELLEEWSWSEHFAAQPETLRYLNHVVDKFDLRRDMQFKCRLMSATFDDRRNSWRLHTQDGSYLSTRFLFTAVGMLSAPTLPNIDGIDTFQGESFHTYHWPHEPVELRGKRVAVIGTGATAVQLIPDIASEVSELTVFQRRPNWCAPLHNDPIDADTMEEIRGSYDSIFERCRETPGAFIHGPDRREFGEVTEEEKRELWESLYDSRGFGVWLGNFVKVLTDKDANAEYSAFIADKIRGRVNDPTIAEKLIPKDHGFGTRRVPLETGYYEAYNRENVGLVDINENPILCVTEKGIKTKNREYEFDLIVYATGFDAITGSFDRIKITGREGTTLRQKWRDGPVTYLGLQTSGFPNLTTLAGPQSASVGTNFPRGIEEAVDWTVGLLQHMEDRGYNRVEARKDYEANWTEHVKQTYEALLVSTTKSWFTGYNSNIPGHDRLRYLVYFGGMPKYRERLLEVATNGYTGFEFS